jgi:poly(A) polymerase
MLRAVRFAAKLDFAIDPLCRDAILELGELLREIPPARLFEEVVKMFHSGHAEKSFDGLLEYGLLEHLFPESTAAIRENPYVREFVRDAMKSTDRRIAEDKPVTPAFLLAAMLWGPVQAGTKALHDDGLPYSVALQKAATKAISDATRHVSIPRRFTTTMRDIWGLQSRFHTHSGRRAWAVLHHPKFRAGYDFLCLRAQAGEDVEDDCRFWTHLQEQPEAEQKKLLSGTGKQGGGRRRGGRRRSRGKKSTPPADG